MDLFSGNEVFRITRAQLRVEFIFFLDMATALKIHITSSRTCQNFYITVDGIGC